MRITTKQLKQIISEEINTILYKEDESEVTPEEIGKIVGFLENAFRESWRDDTLKPQAIMLIEDLFNVEHGKDFAIADYNDFEGGDGSVMRRAGSHIMLFSDNEQFLRTLAVGDKYNVKQTKKSVPSTNGCKGWWEFCLYETYLDRD